MGTKHEIRDDITDMKIDISGNNTYLFGAEGETVNQVYNRCKIEFYLYYCISRKPKNLHVFINLKWLWSSVLLGINVCWKQTNQ